MDTNDICLTSYRAAHRFIPTVAFESNVSSLDARKQSKANSSNLKRWIYDTTTKINYDFKIDTMDPMQRAMRVHSANINYIIPQWEKYWSNPPKPMNIPPTEYNDKYIQSKLMSNINQTSTPIICVQPKHVDHKQIVNKQHLKISDPGIIRKMDPYVSTQKLDYIKINLDTARQINFKQSKQNKIVPEYEQFYNEPIFDRKNPIRLLPNTLKHVPHNALKSEMSASYKTPINTLSKFEGTVEMPVSISKNPTLSQILSVPGMYTTEYAKIGGNN